MCHWSIERGPLLPTTCIELEHHKPANIESSARIERHITYRIQGRLWGALLRGSECSKAKHRAEPNISWANAAFVK